MANLKIPNLKKNSDKLFSKNKLTLRRKSKSKLFNEAFIMFSFSILIIYLNYLIPNKKFIFDNLDNNFKKIMSLIFDLINNLYEIGLAIFIVISLIFASVLILGAFSRLLKISKRKSRQINFK